ncbi:MAG: GTPase HflX [Ignavibacteria bacterium]|nr:GTPase HflX [Ignavibacteria bacterium]
MLETAKQLEKTVLVCYSNKYDKKNFHSEDSLEELKFLAETAGAVVIKSFYQMNDTYDSRYMIGKGKVEEIAQYVEENKIALVIFENELAFTQIRNLEQKIKCKIIDKSNLILDIFASNARTSQAKLQVELAQLEYLLPRLTRQWTHLSKQFGGIGTKGPGETQIETDRRLIGTRISALKEKLVKIDKQQQTQSQERKNFYRISLVGYTNVGKSTLLNLLTDSDVYVENKLFATLDTSTRILSFNTVNKKESVPKIPKKVLISDTVGFIKNLPHGLIESFKSTLSEVVESDILLHVIDISNPHFEEQIAVVEETLKEIGAENKIIVHVFNKVDALENKDIMAAVKEEYAHSVFISAEKGMNIKFLMEKILDLLSVNNKETVIRLKPDDYKGLSNLYQLGEVKEVKYLKTMIKVKMNTTEKNFSKLEKMYA